MRKPLVAAMVAVVAIGPTTLLAAPVTSAGGPCGLSNANNATNQACLACWQANNYNFYACGIGEWTQPRTTQAPPNTTPAQAPSNPPTQGPATMPAQAPSNPATMPAQTPQVVSPPPTVPGQVPATTLVPPSAPPSATVAPPKGLDASPQDIAAAKAAPATQVDPANPPAPPTHADFNQQTQSAIDSHNAHIDVVNGLAHPRHWDYIDYDENQHPILYNPLHEAMTFRYFYGGTYQQVYVAAASRVVLNVAASGVFPFTAVGGNYLTSGSFYGGSPPPLCQNVAAYIPAYDQSVQVGKVQQVGHDDSQPAGSQDTFMLDDSTLAWGQANNPTDGGQITVTKTQTLPGVGPTDDGKSLIDLAVASHPQAGGMIGALIGLVAGLGVLGALGIGGVWIWKRRTQQTA